MSLRISLQIYVFITVLCLVRSQPRNDSNSKGLQISATVITVFRGLHYFPDRLNLCSGEIETIEKYVTQDGESGTMNCSENIINCGEKAGLKGFRCSCKLSSPTYVVNKRTCVNNRTLRKGSFFRFGSWRHGTRWNWNKEEDPLLSLYIDDGYGITGGFNASTTEYESCSLVNITILNDLGDWEMFAYDSTRVTFFKLREYFHINWNTWEMEADSKQKLRGKILRFFISCDTPEVVVQGDSIMQERFASYLPFKVTGNFTYEAEDSDRENPKKAGSTKTLAIALGVTFSLLFIIGLMVGIWFFRRGHGSYRGTFISNWLARKI